VVVKTCEETERKRNAQTTISALTAFFNPMLTSKIGQLTTLFLRKAFRYLIDRKADVPLAPFQAPGNSGPPGDIQNIQNIPGAGLCSVCANMKIVERKVSGTRIYYYAKINRLN
jgi:hypothetical protein